MKKYLSLTLCLITALSLFTACGNVKSDDKYFMLKELPDMSKIESTQKTEYYYGGPIAEFTVSDNYGMIVPFISEVRKFYSVNENSDEMPVTASSYGFATSDGKIIVDGIYDEVRTLTSANGETAYYANSFITTAEDLTGLNAFDVTQKSYIISCDGSWIKEADNVVYSETEEKNYIEAHDGDGLVTLYSFSGKTLFSQKDAMPDCVIESVYYAKNSKFIFDVNYGEKGTKTVCVNENGELLTEIKLGNYRILKMYGSVFTVFNSNSAEKYNLCDFNGNILLEKDFDLLVYDSQQKCFVCSDNESREVKRYDANGQFLDSFKSKYNGKRISNILTGNGSLSFLYKTDGKKCLIYDTSNGHKNDLSLEGIFENGDGETGFNVIDTTLGNEELSFILLEYLDTATESELYDAYGTYIMSFSDYLNSFDYTPDGNYCYVNTDGHFVVRSHSPRNDFELDLKDAVNFSVYTYDSNYISFICTDENLQNPYFKVFDFETKELVYDGLSAFRSFTVSDMTYYALFKDGDFSLVTADGKELLSTFKEAK